MSSLRALMVGCATFVLVVAASHIASAQVAYYAPAVVYQPAPVDTVYRPAYRPVYRPVYRTAYRPVVAYSAPTVAYSAPVYAAPATVYAAPAVYRAKAVVYPRKTVVRYRPAPVLVPRGYYAPVRQAYYYGY